MVYSSPTDVNVYNDQTSAGDEALRTETLYDGFGREVQSKEYEGGGSYIATTQTYDALGRVLTTRGREVRVHVLLQPCGGVVLRDVSIGARRDHVLRRNGPGERGDGKL